MDQRGAQQTNYTSQKKFISHFQIYHDYMQSKYILTPDSEEFLVSFDELYNESNEGMILIRRHPLSMKFQMQVFIDMSNIYKERR